jgi:uncharacterized protein YndB with AHSA1/START domain
MTFDAHRLVGAVKRKVETREWKGKPARVVIADRTYPTDIDDVWDALTNIARIPRWFMPISGELRLGGRYQLQGNAGGVIEDCEPPRRLAVTWEFGGQTSWVIVALTAEGADETRLLLEHIAHEDAQFLGFWDQFGPGAVGVGWDLSLLGLAEHIDTGGAPAAARDEVVWMTQGDGKTFGAASSQAWGEASIAFGADPEAARAAADRTTAFYTGGGEGQGKRD